MNSGIPLTELDPQVSPRDDFFRHANGGWLDSNEIPADRAGVTSFHVLADQAEEQLHAIVEELSADETVEAGSVAAKIRDLYADFMDTEAIEAAGLAPLQADLDRVAACQTPEELARVAGELAREGVPTFTQHYTDQDSGDPDRYLLHFRQGGLGLPDESYYSDEQYAEVRGAYLAYLEGLFRIVGLSDPSGRANDVVDIEARIAGHHWDVVASRDATATYNLLGGAGLEEAMGRFPWAEYAAGLGAPSRALDEVVLAQPSFFPGVGEALREVPISAWRNWLKAAVTSARAPYLTAELDDHHFGFYGTVLEGVEVQRDRWKRGLELLEETLGEGLGELYVARHFPPAAKARMEELVANVVAAYRNTLSELPWMGEETRERALTKLGTFRPKIGYPSSWRDYSALEIRRGDLLGNVRRAATFEAERNFAKVGAPIDREEWFMTPQTINAYYNAGMNEIVFPAAILQPPFFDVNADDAVNYGAIGAVIGHEIGHGFDDQGSKYDERGMLRDWWTEEDRARFDAISAALIEQFNAIESKDLPGQFVNGALTVGENIGDIAGLSTAFAAYRLATEASGNAPVLNGMTGDQRFFIGWARVWRGKVREANAQRRLATDPHAPLEARAGVVRNLHEFHDAFGVTDGDGMWLEPEDRVRVF